MDFTGKTVIHKSLGEGIVIEHTHSKLTVQFSDRKMDFSYPDSFYGFLKFSEPADQAELIAMLKAEEEKRIAAEARDPMRHLVAPRTYQTYSAGPRRSTQTRSAKRPAPPSNIAFKCNYCDGGKSYRHVGYLGPCSDKMIDFNIYEAHHSWCSSEDSPCMQYMNGEISRCELDQMCSDDGYICYESQMLRCWKALAGYGLSGEKKNEPRKIRQVQINSLAILTTREPYADESCRYIFGVFLIDGLDQGGPEREGSVWSDSKYRIELSPDEAHRMKYWNYHANANQPEEPKWSQGLYRYISDLEAAQILRDIAIIKKSRQEKSFAQEFLQHYCKIHRIDTAAIPQANGALKRI